MVGNDTQLAASLKSRDTEEWLDIHFTRPLGLLWARLFAHYKIHPNVVTILSIILGAAAGVMFYFQDIKCTLIGIVLLVWANLYDSADGQLARLTGQKTRWGRILDGFAGDVWFFCIYAAICLRLQDTLVPGTTYHWGWGIWLLCAFSGFVCHGKQCQLADYYRNIHLYFLKGEQGSELDNSQSLKAQLQALSLPREIAWAAFLFFYRRYTQSQEKMTPLFQKFYTDIRTKMQQRDSTSVLAIPESLRDDFRRGSLPLIKYANILTFNTRAIFLYFSLLIDQPWLYPLFEITVLNVIFFYMRYKHESLCQRLDMHLTDYWK